MTKFSIINRIPITLYLSGLPTRNMYCIYMRLKLTLGFSIVCVFFFIITFLNSVIDSIYLFFFHGLTLTK